MNPLSNKPAATSARVKRGSPTRRRSWLGSAGTATPQREAAALLETFRDGLRIMRAHLAGEELHDGGLPPDPGAGGV